MFNVLIADDNSITKQSIMLTIDWPKLNCKVIADADNGVTALSLADRFKPDLIITDIRMPGMDGLNFTEKVKKKYPWMKVIIITGYSEFTYAKEALRIGAFDLVVKPIDNGELCNVIQKAVTTLTCERKEASEKEHLKDAIEKNRDLILTKAVIDSIDGHSHADFLDLQIKRFFLFSVRFRPKDKKTGEAADPDGVAEKIVDVLKEKFGYTLIPFWHNDRFCTVAAEKHGSSGRLTVEGIAGLCHAFLRENETVGGGDCMMGVSRLHTKPEELKAAYRESLDALESGFYFPDKAVIFSDQTGPKGMINESVLIKKVYDKIKAFDIAQFKETMTEIQETLLCETPAIQNVKNLFSNICFIALDFYYNTKGYQYYNYKSHSEIIGELSSFDRFDTMTAYVRSFVEILMTCPDQEAKECYGKVTQQVIDYLNEHYNRKVSLQEIADYVSLTPSHLSRVIKKDTGESFVDLFNSIKISISQKLLKDSNLKVYEVANKVGIENYSYFYQLFKKATGISPTDYYSSRSVDAAGK